MKTKLKMLFNLNFEDKKTFRSKNMTANVTFLVFHFQYRRNKTQRKTKKQYLETILLNKKSLKETETQFI